MSASFLPSVANVGNALSLFFVGVVQDLPEELGFYPLKAMLLMGLAGTPPTTVSAETSFVTTAPAATTAP
jgi:hypothetical protein